MQQHKLDNFLRENPGVEFPSFRKLSVIDCHALQRSLAQGLGLNETSSYELIVKEIAARHHCKNGFSSSAGFSIAHFLRPGEIKPRTVFLDWSTIGSQMYDVDEMDADDFERHFDDIFYKSSDELFVLSADGTLLVYIDDGGYCYRVV